LNLKKTVVYLKTIFRNKRWKKESINI
jgi:hypothetical protein